MQEVLEQMMMEVSASEIRLEQERLAEERRRLEEARSVPTMHCRPQPDLHQDRGTPLDVSTFSALFPCFCVSSASQAPSGAPSLPGSVQLLALLRGRPAGRR